MFLILSFVFYSCQKDNAPIVPTNSKPIIKSISVDTQRVATNKAITINYNLYDKDGDSLAINWNSKRGKFTNQTATTVSWQAPSQIGIDTLTITVSDKKAATNSIVIINVGSIPKKPILLYPVKDTLEVSLSAMLNWKKDNFAENYDLQVSEDKSFTGFVLSRYKLKNNFFSLRGLKINTKYFWRIRSNNKYGNSTWSLISNFTTIAPPSTPEFLTQKDTTNIIPTEFEVNWKPVINANNYEFQAAKDSTFLNLVLSTDSIKTNSISLSKLNNFSTYYLRVRSKNNLGISPWSKSWQVKVIGKVPEKPNIIYPINNSTNNELSIEFKWSKTEFVKHYELQISADSSFQSTIINKSELIDTTYILDKFNNWTKYYWRIRAVNEIGNSSWSDVNVFKTKLATPSSFSANIFETGKPMSPNLTWSKIEGADSYTIQVSKDSLFRSLISETNITDNNYTLTNLDYYTKYYWRVRTNNSQLFSDWSPHQTFNSTGYYYQALDYGHQSVYNPIYVILNGGYDMIQVGNQRDVKNFPYPVAVKNIWKNLSSPFGPIGRYGWWDFIKEQVLPLSLNKKSAQFWPNYSLHLIGGGMEYAAIREWYRYYNYPLPSVMAATTIMGYHFLNEVVENGKRIGDDVDPIADFYIFDIGGIILFSSESVKKFFAEELNLADWSQQPSFSLKNGELHNNGQFFSVKWKFPFSDSWHAFYYFGTNGVGGLSYKFKDGTAISFGAGLAAGDLILLNENTNKKTLGLVGNFAAFYDKNNSLLAALSVTIKTDYMINLNIYPGLVKFWRISPGLWGAYSQNGNYIFGITAAWLPFGFAYSTK